MLVVPALHPAAVLRVGEGYDAFAKFDQTTQRDFKKAARMFSSGPVWDESCIWEVKGGRFAALFPTEQEVYEFLGGLRPGTELVVDVETTGEEPLDCRLICVGMGYADPLTGRDRVLCAPFIAQGGHRYWASDAELRVHAALRWAMGQLSIPKTFHNGAFDSLVLGGQDMPVQGFSDDTMAQHHVLDSELPHGLGFVGSLYLDTRYWKDDVKGSGAWLELPDVVLRSYNVRDVLVTKRIRAPLSQGLKDFGLEHVYREDMDLIRVMLRASKRGLFVDRARREDPTLDAKGKPIGLRPALVQQKEAALGVLRGLAGDPTFEPNRPGPLQHFFFRVLGFPVVKVSQKTGKPVLDKDALQMLELRADTPTKLQALKALVSYRQADKFLGTFVDGMPPHPLTGAVHPQWKALTTSGRLASSPNAQNFSRKVKRMFRARPGFKFVSSDLSQAELRLIAYYSNDQDLLYMYEQGLNVHTVNAALLFQVKCPVPEDTNPQTEAYLRAAVPRLLGPQFSYDAFPVLPVGQWKETRTLAKNFVFGSNYGAIAETLHRVLRSKRDPESGDLLFPKIQLGEIEALQVIWKKLHPELTRWQESYPRLVERQRFNRCAIGGRIRWFRGGFKHSESLNCLDAETEALTRRGWIRGFDLHRDDILLTKNPVTGALEWQGMTDLRLFPNHVGRVVEFRSRSFNAVSTLNHRWLVRDRRTNRNVCKTSDELDRYGFDGIHRTGLNTQVDAPFSDDVLALIGWFLTDASYRELARVDGVRPAVTIVQSRFANPAKVRLIDELIARLGLKVWRKAGDIQTRSCEAWVLDAQVSAWLHGIFPQRTLTNAFVFALSQRQANHLVDIMMLGDGSYEPDRESFGCGSREKAEGFQLLLFMAGHASSITVREPTGRVAMSNKLQAPIVAKKPFWVVRKARRKFAQVVESQRREFEGHVPVWCPIVPNTFFVARRERSIFITGNTPIQTGVASWMNRNTIEIQKAYDLETGGEAQIVQQVHDALVAEVPEAYAPRAAFVMEQLLNRKFQLFGFSLATLPTDKAKIHDYL